MPKRLEKLTREQEAQLAPWAKKWIKKGLRTWESDGPTTEAEWASCEDAIRRCYAHTKLAPPKVIVRVGSPLVLAYAGPIAAHVLADLSGGKGNPVVRGAVYSAVRGAVGGAVRGAVRDAVESAVRGAVDSAVGGAVDSAVYSAVGGAVGGAVDSAVRGAVGGAVRGAVRGAVDIAVDSAVDIAVDSAVRGAVYSAVDSAVRGAVYSVVRGAVKDSWQHVIGGSFWASWSAYSSFFRDVCKLDLGADLNAREMAYREANTLGWWWPHSEFVILCDRPRNIRLDDEGQLHSVAGLPAIDYAGFALYAWQGTVVPEWMFTSPERITSDAICEEQDRRLRSAMVALAPGATGVLHALAGDA